MVRTHRDATRAIDKHERSHVVACGNSSARRAPIDGMHWGPRVARVAGAHVYSQRTVDDNPNGEYYHACTVGNVVRQEKRPARC